ncbi:lactoylglutathione lyase [Methylophilaceae bacterium]|jgi:lactoylglutathione lyase|nr:lactoylglutathione lyase [Betaproteobacteria bacterium]MDA9087524.1 lactoylglutathione lyase [Methylophilaceae bacterium]MCH9842126.1 lactoylglutathione lyase [Betaproteobacteria bacterium]MDA9096951.1 lactoylglutathione lyase [Methylophilaceae bacterium]MDA9819251.1 lactoylglutathione lyase [Methylophilaceae bacterium]
MRILHTMIRVKSLEDSIKFYENFFSMRVLRKQDFPEGKFSLAFIGYGEEDENTVIELTYNWDTTEYDHGNAFGHIAIEVEDAYKTCDDIRKKGGRVIREAGPMMHGTTIIAFIEDPNGYKIELIQKGTF